MRNRFRKGILSLCLSCLFFISSLGSCGTAIAAPNAPNFAFGAASQTSNADLHRYRVSGTVMAMEEDGFRADIWDIKDIDSINELFRYSNQVFTRSEMNGSVEIQLPTNATNPGSVRIWDTIDPNTGNSINVPQAYFEQKYFEFEFETEGELGQWDPVINCSIRESDAAPNDDDTVCNTNREYNIDLGLDDVGEPVAYANQILFKLESSTRPINDLVELLRRLSELDPNDIDKPALIDILEDASGLWIENFKVTEITDTSLPDNRNFEYVRLKGHLDVENISEKPEPYGQVYILPGTTQISASEVLRTLKDNLNLDISDELINSIQLTLTNNNGLGGYQIYDNPFSGSVRQVPKDQQYYFDKWIRTPVGDNTLGFFSNVWEKDDANYDDCWARGNDIGVDQITITSDASIDLAACQEDKNPRLKVVIDSANTYPLSDATNEVPWRLQGDFYFDLGDKGDPIEPYGYLDVTIPSPNEEHQYRQVWKDAYVDNDAGQQGSLPDENIKFPIDIHFNSYDDLIDQNLELSFWGDLKEDDGSGDDNYYESSECSNADCRLTVNTGSLANRQTYELPRKAKEKNHQHAYVDLKLVRGSDNVQRH